MGSMANGGGQKSGDSNQGKKQVKKQPGKLRRVRLIPAAHSSLFPDDRPLTAYLKPTDDPHIWKIIGTRPRPTGAGSGSSAEETAAPAGAAQELADSVLMSIIQATDLLLDEAPLQLKEQVFRTSHHALRLLLQVKKARTVAAQKEALQLLQQVLDDLYRLRGIADEEDRFLGEGETLDL